MLSISGSELGQEVESESTLAPSATHAPNLFVPHRVAVLPWIFGGRALHAQAADPSLPISKPFSPSR